MKAYQFIEGKEGIIKIENRIEVIQQFVGGTLEKTNITDELVIFNDKNCDNDYLARAVWMEDDKVKFVFLGDCLVCRCDKDGALIDIEESDISIIQEKLKPIVIMLGTDIYVGR